MNEGIEQKQRNEPRTAADIINELDREALKFTELVLAVCSVGRTKLIAASEAQRLMKLNAAIAEGGEPIGLIGYAIEKRRVRFYARLLEEFANEGWAPGLLDCLLTKFIKAVSESQGFKDFDTEDGWIN